MSGLEFDVHGDFYSRDIETRHIRLRSDDETQDSDREIKLSYNAVAHGATNVHELASIICKAQVPTDNDDKGRLDLFVNEGANALATKHVLSATSQGFLGVGTETPTALLEVNGTAKIREIQLSSGTGEGVLNIGGEAEGAWRLAVENGQLYFQSYVGGAWKTQQRFTASST